MTAAIRESGRQNRVKYTDSQPTELEPENITCVRRLACVKATKMQIIDLAVGKMLLLD